MSNRHRALQRQLQRHIDVPARVEHSPVLNTIWNEHVRFGDQVSTPSPVGRKKTPRYADVGHETMNPELILQYRARIASGVYDATASIHALAEALLTSYDL